MQIAASLQGTQFDLILLDIDLGESRNALDMMDLLRASGVLVLVLSNRATVADKHAHELPHMSGQQTVVLTHLVRDPGRHTDAIAREMGVSMDWEQTLVSQLCSSYRVRNRAE